MSRIFLLAFVAVAASAVGAVDYVNQSRRAGLAPGAMKISAYLDTINGRFLDQKQSIAAATLRADLRAMAPRDHLPAAPEGWVRRDWTAADVALLSVGPRSTKDALPPEVAGDRMFAGLAAASDARAAERDAREVYVYETAGALVALRLRYLGNPAAAGLAAPAMTMVAGNIEAMSGKQGFAVIRGVTWREELGLFGAGAAERDYRVVTAQLGDGLALSARMIGSDDSVIALLSAIDYDGLNRMLEVPVAGIGSQAPEMSAETSRAEAARRVEIAALRQRHEAADREYRVQLAALDMLHRRGTIDDAKYAQSLADLEKHRGALDGLSAAVSEAEAHLAPTEHAAGPSPAPIAVAGGIAAALGRVFGGVSGSSSAGGADTDADPAAAPPEPAPSLARDQIKVNRLIT